MDKEKDQVDEVVLRDRLLMSEPEVAFVCGVSRPVVRRWRDEGLISPVKLPFSLRRILYRRSDVEAFVERLPAAGGEAE
jgi:predicted site-specific integrase-resolvase